jgi:predicted RNA-binding Zn-ribbon protein involved in translation (DUF1610 family)
MKKIITKTSLEARKEKEEMATEHKCPECLNQALSTISTRTVGLFKMKTQYKKNYTCFNCGCEWTLGWQDKR